jgi:hypothetical protein
MSEQARRAVVELTAGDRTVRVHVASARYDDVLPAVSQLLAEDLRVPVERSAALLEALQRADRRQDLAGRELRPAPGFRLRVSLAAGAQDREVSR